MDQLMTVIGDHLAPGSPIADKVLNWPGDPMPTADSVPLRLAGALHAVARQDVELAAAYPPNTVSDDALWAAITTAFDRHEPHVLAMLDSAPQTNEVRRSAAIIPALHLLTAHFSLPIALTEVGASGGLNLCADQFRMTAGNRAYGPAQSPVHLAPEWTGRAPEPTDLAIASRKGVDLNPLDPATEGNRLIAYLWPDQTDRIARTEAAIEIARHHPATLIKADAVNWLTDHFAPIPGQLHLLFHTIAWQYLPEMSREKGEAAIAATAAHATPEAPVARLAMEADGKSAALTLHIWPPGAMIDLGRADYHGRWIDWSMAALEGLSDDA